MTAANTSLHPPELRRLLARWWSKGHSAGMIALLLRQRGYEGITVNVVLGLRRRMGLKPHGRYDQRPALTLRERAIFIAGLQELGCD